MGSQLCLPFGVVRGFRLLAIRGQSKTNLTRMTACDKASLEVSDLLKVESHMRVVLDWFCIAFSISWYRDFRLLLWMQVRLFVGPNVSPSAS